MTTWALTGDERLLAYENACELHGILTDALNALSAKGTDVDLDDVAWTIPSESDVVLGERGKRVTRRGNDVVAFDGHQLLAQAELLGELLPMLAADAHAAREEWKARQAN